MPGRDSPRRGRGDEWQLRHEMLSRLDRRAVEHSLAARLIASGKLDQAALDRASRVQANNGERLEALLVKLGLISERDIAEALAAELALPIAEPADYPDTPVLAGKINE